LTNDTLEGLLDFQAKTKKLVREFTSDADFLFREFNQIESQYENKLFKFKGTALGSSQDVLQILRPVLWNTLEDSKEVNIYASTTLARLQRLQGYLNEIEHLNQAPLPSNQLWKLSKEYYWKKRLLPFKYEFSIVSFDTVVEELAAYYLDIQHTINFVSGVQATLNDLSGELHTFKNKLKNVTLFTTEKGGPVASMKFYRDLFAEIGHDLEANINKTTQLAMQMEISVQPVLVEIPFNLPKFNL